MTTTHPTTGAPAVAKDTPSSHTGWFVAAIVVLAALVALFATLWLVERNDASSMESDLEATTQALTVADGEVSTLQAEVSTLESEVSMLEADVAVLTPETTVTDPMHADTRALYEDFLVAIQDPEAATISAMFAPYASHTNASGVTERGAEAIGAGWEVLGPITVDDPGALIVRSDNGFAVAAMTGSVNGVEGLLVTRVGLYGGQLVFYDMVWYDG